MKAYRWTQHHPGCPSGAQVGNQATTHTSPFFKDIVLRGYTVQVGQIVQYQLRHLSLLNMRVEKVVHIFMEVSLHIF